MKEYKSPVLCIIIQALAAITVGVGLTGGLVERSSLSIVALTVTVMGSTVAGLILWGLAKVIDLVGRAAHFAERAYDTQEQALRKSETISTDIKWLCQKAEEMEPHLQQLDWLHTIAN